MSSARVAFVLSFERKVVDGVPVAEIKVDSGDGDATLHDHWQPVGEDSQPCVGDAVLLVDSATGSGQEEIVGYADVENAGSAGPGEKRLYARTAAGEIVGEVWLKADGTVNVVASTGLIIGEGAASAMVLGTELKAKLDKILAVVTAWDSVINGAPVTEPGNGAASAFQVALTAAQATAALPDDLDDVLSTKHKIDQ
jgi:hypothetical protein